MDLVVFIVLLVVLVKGASVLGVAFGRSGPAGLLGGMFAAPSLDWPHGVQEEDRDRAWSWEAAAAELPATEPPGVEVVEVVEVTAERAPVQPVRRRRARDGVVAISARAAVAVAPSAGQSGRGS
jgi:hypothetical protein